MHAVSLHIIGASTAHGDRQAAFASVQGAFELLGSGRSGKIILLMEMAGVRPFACSLHLLHLLRAYAAQ